MINKQNNQHNKQSHEFETMLVLQGGGSLGAYECGVFSTLYKHEINFDLVIGTSIGAINASIITGTKNQDKSSERLEEFWLELSENMTTEFLPEKMRTYHAVLSSALFGNSNVVKPYFGLPNPWMFAGSKPFLYDNTPLKTILKRYVDFDFLNKEGNSRLIVTAVDIKAGKPIVFDSHKTKIDADHIISSTGFPFYGINWTKKDGMYLWDGSLMSNTPFREAVNASPQKDKIVYLVSLFPKVHDALPQNMEESWHRARDIMYSDKIDHNIMMSKVFSRYLILLKKMHTVLDNAQLDENLKKEFQNLKPEYSKLVAKRGAIIKDMIKIERKEESHFLLEDADFSKKTIKQLIHDGKNDAEQILNHHHKKNS